MDTHSEKRLPRILVIDDEPGICLAIALLLQDQFEVVTAGTVQEGLAHLGEQFSLILLDLRMPGVCGYDLLNMVRSQVANTPVAVLSAMGDLRTQEEVKKCGAASLIEKPFSRQELLTQIHEILGDSETLKREE